MTMMAQQSTNPVDLYARRVVAGEILAGKYHRLACVRHLRDRAREGTPSFPYRFVWEDRDGAGRLTHCAVRFLNFASLFRHYKGKKRWAGQAFEPSEFQIFRLGSTFGWRHSETGLRRFTTGYNELPRKQGKSFEAAIVALYVTFFEGTPGAEGYVIATKRQQATIVFEIARQLVIRNRAGRRLLCRLVVGKHSIYDETTGSKLEPLGADSDSTDGLSPSLTVGDELHAYKNRGLLDVMESATGARDNPLMFQITTAGDDPISVCGDQHDYACNILDGVLTDDAAEAFFCCIAHADLEDDWQDEATWRKANPHFGGSVDPAELRKLALKAKHMPSAAAEFKQKNLNLWVNASNPCLSMDGWRKGQNPDHLTKEAWLAGLKHESCYVGIDLASKLDLCAMTFLFPPTVGRTSWRLLQYIWTPEETLFDRAHRDRAPYQVWRDQGWLRTTPGPTINHNVIRDILTLHREDFDIEQIGFDPWHADKLIDDLITLDGFSKEQVLEVRQTYAGMSSAEAHFQAEVLAGHVDARGCPVTAWAAANVVNQSDGKGNIFFTKKKSRGRIDPIKSATTAMSLALRAVVARPPAFQMLILGAR